MSSKSSSLPPPYSTPASAERPAKRSNISWPLIALYAVCMVSFASSFHHFVVQKRNAPPAHAEAILKQCAALHSVPTPPDLTARKVSDRYVPGTKSYLIQNATIWTGNKKGTEVIYGGDILIDGGIIKAVGDVPDKFTKGLKELVTINVERAWVTPGIFDLHSHLGDDSVPALEGTGDTNSVHGIAQPWLRSIDGFNTHDQALELSISGGVTASLVLPGSANAVGGQAFVFKLRPTKERSPISRVLEPPYELLNGEKGDPSLPQRWRHMKHACGENPSRVYKGTRMDTLWAFRQAYNEARKVKEKQDEFCSKAEAGLWNGLDKEFPDSLQWEALVDVLRGKVKVNVHCYESMDFDGIVRLTNEFKFPVAAFHHAHEAYLVPDLIKKAYGQTPGIAIFATNARYKKEAFRGSEYAARILSENGLRVVMKSDHPVLDSRFLLYEAAQASYYGLDSSLAIAAVTSTPAELAGFGHRLGYLRKGYDADLVVWDSHPLALGATPQQVWIDGIPQLHKPHISAKPRFFQEVPETPNFDKETEDAVKYEGLPPLEPKVRSEGVVVFTNVRTFWGKDSDGNVVTVFDSKGDGMGIVVVDRGQIICSGVKASCATYLTLADPSEFIDVKAGSLSPGFITYGSPLGLVEIVQEASTNDGVSYDALRGDVPKILRGIEDRAVDGLQFGTRNALIAYRSGVTAAITAPQSTWLFGGISAAFSLGVNHRLAKGAILKKDAALHVRVGHYGRTIPAVSEEIAVLRRLLLQPGEDDSKFKAVAEGSAPLIIEVHNRDHIATLLALKAEVEAATGKKSKWAFTGATESYLLASEIAEAGVAIILSPSRPFPSQWDRRRVLAGPPLSEETTISILFKHGVTVAIGAVEEWQARNIRFDIAWAALEANGTIDKKDAIALGSSNLEKIFGLEKSEEYVVYSGGDLFELRSKPIGVVSASRGQVDLF